MAQGDLKILTGTSNPVLAAAICDHLGCTLLPAKVGTFSDGEIRVEIGANVRGSDIFVVQSTSYPVNFNLMELSLMLDALKRASAQRVTAVVPYYGYARQDRKVAPRAPISAKLVADFLTVAGMNRLLTIDLHAGQIQGFFNLPVDNLFSAPIMAEYFKEFQGQNLCVVSPDAGGVERARSFAKRLGATLAIIDKRRDAPNQAQAMHVIGDVKDKLCVVLDDMIDTAGTICQAGTVLLDNGAREVLAAATHPVLSGPAIERLDASPFSQIVTTNTIPLNDTAKACSKIKILSIAGLLAKAIHNIHTESSVSVLFT
ncbi:ribose-phosphate pyrophosphokinase [Solidesulfovibrio sp.]|uniref:ribose-phosphate diphosphokinase n=1 Tax=Solidesulfovibrio sp. TaxID=2910990 RepID=UPI002B1FE804|nr:ribose-phosphate pyrophosphokinase [Solidesulfovibrio sp.]MEA4857659.1 ribose-phosphate pyrophosphokinase [Solidesulfovibrio sp.]